MRRRLFMCGGPLTDEKSLLFWGCNHPGRALAILQCSAPTPRRGGAVGPEPGTKDLGGTLAERGVRNKLNDGASCRVANPTQRALISQQAASMARSCDEAHAVQCSDERAPAR